MIGQNSGGSIWDFSEDSETFGTKFWLFEGSPVSSLSSQHGVPFGSVGVVSV